MYCVATGAIGIGMLVAESMGLPFVYVRAQKNMTKSRRFYKKDKM
jgi:adenine/guanine phosphoribosyltransferase-like PRPP-binding protein